jgi:hypothetical protein
MVIHVARLRQRRADNVSIFFLSSSMLCVIGIYGFPVRVDVHPSVARYAHMDAVVW